MSPRPIASGFVLCLALVAPCAANAQAAGWILWEKNMINKPGSPEVVTWEPLDGYAALAECRKAGQDNLKNALAYMNSGAGKLLGPVRPDGRSAMFAVTDTGAGQTVDIRYLCFPGAFDPRPRIMSGGPPSAEPASSQRR
jgi:hypothetical protein